MTAEVMKYGLSIPLLITNQNKILLHFWAELFLKNESSTLQINPQLPSKLNNATISLPFLLTLPVTSGCCQLHEALPQAPQSCCKTEHSESTTLKFLI
jgi:hypothetical protein